MGTNRVKKAKCGIRGNFVKKRGGLREKIVSVKKGGKYSKKGMGGIL